MACCFKTLADSGMIHSPVWSELDKFKEQIRKQEFSTGDINLTWDSFSYENFTLLEAVNSVGIAMCQILC